MAYYALYRDCRTHLREAKTEDNNPYLITEPNKKLIVIKTKIGRAVNPAEKIPK